MHGLILTHCYTLNQVAAALNAGRMDALKVVTGWGVEGGWTEARRQQAAALAKHLVVRTVAGDPSYQDGAHAFPEANKVCAELAPWLAIRPDAWVEIGNEPNVADRGEMFVWGYRYHLLQTIPAVRQRFPRARLIAPGLLLDGINGRQQARWLEICGDVLAQCNAVGVHVYEYDAFNKPEQRHGTTNQVAEAQRLYGELDLRVTRGFYPEIDKRLRRALPRIVTEYGINDPGTAPTMKGQRYAAFVRANPIGAVGHLAYHLCADEVIQPEYNLGRLGWERYGEAK